MSLSTLSFSDSDNIENPLNTETGDVLDENEELDEHPQVNDGR